MHSVTLELSFLEKGIYEAPRFQSTEVPNTNLFVARFVNSKQFMETKDETDSLYNFLKITETKIPNS